MLLFSGIWGKKANGKIFGTTDKTDITDGFTQRRGVRRESEDD